MKELFPKLSKIFESKKGERFEVDVFSITEEEVKLAKLRGALNYNTEFVGLEPGEYVRLVEKKTNAIIMSDTEMEKRTNLDFLYRAHGNILIGGLGLGMIVLAVQNNPEVKSIIVVEKYKEIIDLVLPQLELNSKVTVIHSDIYEWLPADEIKFNVVYFDIVNNICADDYDDMMKLKRRFRKYLDKSDPEKYIGFWREYDFRRKAAENRKWEREMSARTKYFDDMKVKLSTGE